MLARRPQKHVKMPLTRLQLPVVNNIKLHLTAFNGYIYTYALSQKKMLATIAMPIIHLVCPTKFCISFVLNFSWDNYNAQWKFERVVNAINVGSQTRCIMDNVKVANVMTKHQQELHDLQYNFFSHTTGSHVKPAMQPKLYYINTTIR